MMNKTLIFVVICGIISLYFIYNLIVHILDAKNRNNEIEIAKNSMLKANREMNSAKQELIAEIEKQYNLQIPVILTTQFQFKVTT